VVSESPVASVPEPPAPLLFLLRVWPGEASFRAALRPVGGAEPAGVFSRPEQLADYLLRLQPVPTIPQRQEGP